MEEKSFDYMNIIPLVDVMMILLFIVLMTSTIKAGDNEVVIAGGIENMSNVPIGLPKARWGHRMDMPFGKTVDLMVFDALYENFYGYHMGIPAENIAA